MYANKIQTSKIIPTWEFDFSPGWCMIWYKIGWICELLVMKESYYLMFQIKQCYRFRVIGRILKVTVVYYDGFVP